MHVVRLENGALFGDLLCSHGQESCQVDLFVAAFKEALVEYELIQVDVLQHVVDLFVRYAERFGYVDPELLLNVDEDNHPVGLATRLQVILVKGGHAQELKNLVFVDVLAHVADDVLLQVTELEELAEVDKVKLVFICESQVVLRAGHMVEQVLDVLVVLAGLEIRLVVDHDFDLRGVSAVLLALCLVDVECVEDVLCQREGILLADLDQLVRIRVD